MDCSLSGSSIHGIFQARVLEWIAIPSPRDLPDPGIEPGSPTLQTDALTSEPPKDTIKKSEKTCADQKKIFENHITNKGTCIQSQQVLARKWRNWNPHALLVELQNLKLPL